MTNVTGATVTDGQGQGTIQNDDTALIHDVQGNGAATPIPGSTVKVEGVVVADFQASSQLEGFFLQEEDADADADPATSEGIFVSCGACSTAVAEGQRVEVEGSVAENSGRTEMTASSVTVTEAGNNLAQITPSPIDLPIVGVVDDFYEAREGMVVAFVDQLTVSDVSELSHLGQLTLTEGTRPSAFTETNAPSIGGLAAYRDSLQRRQVIVDDDDDVEQSALLDATGMQAVYLPRANGGFSVGTQGIDFVRAGDVVHGLSGVLDWSSPGIGAATWRLRPRQASPATFTVANPRPAATPTVGGVLHAASVDLGDYFTTIDTTSSSARGPVWPVGNPRLSRRRQRRRAEPPARARVDRHLFARCQRDRPHRAREHDGDRDDRRLARGSERALWRQLPVRIRQHGRNARRRRRAGHVDLPRRHRVARRVTPRRPRSRSHAAADGADVRHRRCVVTRFR